MPKDESKLFESYKKRYDELYEKNDKLKKEYLNVCKKNKKHAEANVKFYNLNRNLIRENTKLRKEIENGINKRFIMIEKIKRKDNRIKELEEKYAELLLKFSKEN